MREKVYAPKVKWESVEPLLVSARVMITRLTNLAYVSICVNWFVSTGWNMVMYEYSRGSTIKINTLYNTVNIRNVVKRSHINCN